MNFTDKLDLKEALASRFYRLSIFMFWAFTGLVFIYSIYSSQQVQSAKQSQDMQSVDLSSEAIK